MYKMYNKYDTMSRPTDEISLGSHVHGAPAEGILRGPVDVALVVFAGQYDVSDGEKTFIVRSYVARLMLLAKQNN